MTDVTVDSADFPVVAVGQERFKSDRRQLGGLMLLLGTCATFQPLAGVASLVGTDDTGAATPLEKSALAAGLIQIVFGSLAMVVGYLSLIHDYGNMMLSGTLIFLTQFAWMPFITGMVEVGKAASSPYVINTSTSIIAGVITLEDYASNPFIPDDYLPTIKDVRFFGAMGILGILSYGIAFLGSLAFTEFAIYAFDVKKPTARDARYYRGRLLFYTFVLVIAGASQLLLGGYILVEYGQGPLRPSVGVAMYTVHYPEITVTIGTIQMLVGYYGVARYLGWVPVGPNNHEYQILLFIQWLSMLLMQYLVQIGYGPGDENAAAVPSLALLSVGLSVFPAFLDYKMRTVPHVLTQEYYGIMEPNKTKTYHEPGPAGFERLDSEDSFQPDGDGEFETGNVTPFGMKDGDFESLETGINRADFLADNTAEEEKRPEFQYPASILRSADNEDDTEPSIYDPFEYSDKPEPSARLDSRQIDTNEEVNKMYEIFNQSYNDDGVEKGESLRNSERPEPSGRLDDRSVDPNDLANELYKEINQSQAFTEPRTNKSTRKKDGYDRLEPLNDMEYPNDVRETKGSATSHDEPDDRQSMPSRDDATSGDEMSGDEMSGDAMSGAEMSGDEISGDEISGDEISGDEMSGAGMSGDEISGDEISRDEISRDEISGDEISGDSGDNSEDTPVMRGADDSEILIPSSWKDPPLGDLAYKYSSDDARPELSESSMSRTSSNDDDAYRQQDPPERIRTLSDDILDRMRLDARVDSGDDASGVYAGEEMSVDTPSADGTEDLEQRLGDIEKELFADSIDAFSKSLEEIF